MSERSYANIIDNKLALINESLVTLTLVHFMVGSDYSEDIEIKNLAGMGLLVILMTKIVFNFSVLFIRVVREMEIETNKVSENETNNNTHH